jgi:cysteine desulfurase
VKIPALVHGGGHERGLRSGTLNVPGIVALGTACAIAQKEMATTAHLIKGLRDLLESELLRIEGAAINGNAKSRLYNTTNILFRGIDSDALILGLSNPENNTPAVAVSNGSACTSASIEPSHVLTAMGLDEVTAFYCIRLSLGKFNTKTEIDIAINSIRKVIQGLRSMSRV